MLDIFLILIKFTTDWYIEREGSSYSRGQRRFLEELNDFLVFEPMIFLIYELIFKRVVKKCLIILSYAIKTCNNLNCKRFKCFFTKSLRAK
jgi:hypothetical protein